MSTNLVAAKICEKVQLQHNGEAMPGYPTPVRPRQPELGPPAEMAPNPVRSIAKYGKRGYRAKRTRKQVVEHRRPSGRAMFPTMTSNEWTTAGAGMRRLLFCR